MRKMEKHVDIIRRRHPEWREHHLRWRWLLDSLEGGERYRQAVYGFDSRGLPVHNLIRHKREYPDPGDSAHAGFGSGVDGWCRATDDDFELRRARTPVPTFVAETVETHLSRIFSREVKRKGPDRLAAWWASVDGCETSIDQWMSETVAPLLLVLGQIDIYLDHPLSPEGETIRTRADAERHGLDRVIGTVILPENVVWWRLDSTGCRYEECLVRETLESDNGTIERYRHWTVAESVLYDAEGERLATTAHSFGRVPIIRVFDARKTRCRHVGQSRYEGIAERQREYYNRDSELILSDTTQAHPLLQGPEDFIQADGTIPIGPSWLLPKKKCVSGHSTSYEGFDIVAFPKDGALSIRKNKQDLRDDVDRDSALVRPCGREGVPASGLAKMIDHSDGNNRLAKIAKTLARAERMVAELALLVISDGLMSDREEDRVEITYPAEFDLYTAGDVASASADFQSIAARAGMLPATEGHLLGRLMRLCLPGLSDAQYSVCDQEIKNHVRKQLTDVNRESSPLGSPAQPYSADIHRW